MPILYYDSPKNCQTLVSSEVRSEGSLRHLLAASGTTPKNKLLYTYQKQQILKKETIKLSKEFQSKYSKFKHFNLVVQLSIIEVSKLYQLF